MTDPTQEPKLIIDEDWKTRVQREKEELEQQKKVDATQDVATGATGEDQASPAKTSAADPGQLPPASLMLLVASLGSQAMVAMGLIPGETHEAAPINPSLAKHFIDLIAVIEEKTKGNLSAEENQYLQETLYSLRMAFVEVKKRHPQP